MQNELKSFQPDNKENRCSLFHSNLHLPQTNLQYIF